MGPAVPTNVPDWNDLRDVLLVHEAGSLSAAARLAGVSQSTMSRRLAAIETAGRKIFARDSHGRLSLTERGEALVAAAREMRAAYRARVAALASPHPPLRIAACEVTAQMFMVDALPAWSERSDAPADLSIYEDLFKLTPADYDVVVTPAEDVPPDLTGIEIGLIGWGLFAAPVYLSYHPVRVGANSLEGHRVIRASGSLAKVGGYRWLEERGGNAVLLSSSPFAQREACLRGQGIALLPLSLAESDRRLERIDMCALGKSSVWLLADVHEASHPRIASFMRWARQHFRNQPSGQHTDVA